MLAMPEVKVSVSGLAYNGIRLEADGESHQHRVCERRVILHSVANPRRSKRIVQIYRRSWWSLRVLKRQPQTGHIRPCEHRVFDFNVPSAISKNRSDLFRIGSGVVFI